MTSPDRVDLREKVAGWRPIASAPRDGSAILAASLNHEHVEVVCWQDGLPSGSLDAMEHPDEPEEGWVNNGATKDRFYANPRWFTHWAPLPAPPSREVEPSSRAEGSAGKEELDTVNTCNVSGKEDEGRQTPEQPQCGVGPSDLTDQGGEP